MMRAKEQYTSGKKQPRQLFFLPLIFCCLMLVTGCVNYDVGVTFDSQTHGEIVQHIKLGERLTSFNQNVVKEWLNSVEQRVKQLKGRTQRVSDVEVAVTIPFNNGKELEQKFNQFFNPLESTGALKNQASQDLPQFDCHLDLTQNNYLLALRNRFDLELDLRSLSFLSASGSVVVTSGNLFELAFGLTTPWGAKTLAATATDSIHNTEVPLEVASLQDGKQFVWTLKPGEINHLEVIFWVPSPIGVGAVIIALLVAAGIYLKYQILPLLGIGKPPLPKQV